MHVRLFPETDDPYFSILAMVKPLIGRDVEIATTKLGRPHNGTFYRGRLVDARVEDAAQMGREGLRFVAIVEIPEHLGGGVHGEARVALVHDWDPFHSDGVILRIETATIVRPPAPESDERYCRDHDLFDCQFDGDTHADEIADAAAGHP